MDPLCAVWTPGCLEEFHEDAKLHTELWECGIQALRDLDPGHWKIIYAYWKCASSAMQGQVFGCMEDEVLWTFSMWQEVQGGLQAGKSTKTARQTPRRLSMRSKSPGRMPTWPWVRKRAHCQGYRIQRSGVYNQTIYIHNNTDYLNHTSASKMLILTEWIHPGLGKFNTS